MFAIYKKELKVYFTTLLGYIVMTFYLLIAAGFFYGTYIYGSGARSDFSSYFGIMNSIFLFIIPIITLRILAEDKKVGTFEILLTSPKSSWQIIMGKFFGVLTFVMVAGSLLLLYPVMISFFAPVDWGTVFASYIGMILSLAFFIAIGMAASSLTENYVIAGITAFGMFFILFLISLFRDVPVEWLSAVFTEIAYAYHYEQFSKGIFAVKNLLYFIIGTFLFLYFAKNRIESKTWK